MSETPRYDLIDNFIIQFFIKNVKYFTKNF